MLTRQFLEEMTRQLIEAAIWREEIATGRPITPTKRKHIEHFYGKYDSYEEMILEDMRESLLDEYWPFEDI